MASRRLSYANDPLTASLSWQACEADREFAHYNVIERFRIYLPLSHAEELKLQELSIEKFARWSVDLVTEAPPERRRINQFVSWSMVKAASSSPGRSCSNRVRTRFMRSRWWRVSGCTLCGTYADELRYRRENGRIHLSLRKRIGA